VLVPSSTVRLNRAVAVAMAAGPRAGLDVLHGMADTSAVAIHPLLPAVQADLLRGLDRRAEAAAAYRLALETSMPGGFAAGDVRHRSVKRVASAVGEGSIAATQLTQYLLGRADQTVR